MTGAAAPPGWSEAELETLVVLAEAFVPGQASRRALMAAEAFDLGLDPHQVRQLKLALRLLESRPANAVLAGRPDGDGALRGRSEDPCLRPIRTGPRG